MTSKLTIRPSRAPLRFADPHGQFNGPGISRPTERSAAEGDDIWFALSEDRPLACFASIFTDGWTSTRKLADGETTDDLYAFLTTEPNAEVKAIHPKAMPVILFERDEIDAWLSASSAEAKGLQRPLSDSALQIVSRGSKRDGIDV